MPQQDHWRSASLFRGCVSLSLTGAASLVQNSLNIFPVAHALAAFLLNQFSLSFLCIYPLIQCLGDAEGGSPELLSLLFFELHS